MDNVDLQGTNGRTSNVPPRQARSDLPRVEKRKDKDPMDEELHKRIKASQDPIGNLTDTGLILALSQPDLAQSIRMKSDFAREMADSVSGHPFCFVRLSLNALGLFS